MIGESFLVASGSGSFSRVGSGRKITWTHTTPLKYPDRSNNGPITVNEEA